MNKATLQTIIEDRIFNLVGNSFQDLCDRLCLKLYPDDYTPVRAGGPKGDTKMDGYCPKKRIYFAAHATRGEKTSNIKKKIESDLKGCLKQHKDAKKWIFLTNDTLLGDVETYIQNLRTKYTKIKTKIKIETWGHKKITEKIIKFNETNISEIIGLDLGVTLHLQSEIESTAKLLKKHKSSEALVLLERLWEQHKSDMTGNQKYRTRANIGHAYLAQDQYEKAAHCFLEAIQYDPENERARAREALAYLLLGNPRKAHELAKALLNDFPEEKLGRAVYVRSAPKELKFGEIEKMVPEHQREDSEVAMAMGEAAMYRGRFDIAEIYIGKALKKEPTQPQIKEVLGDLLLQRARISEQAVNDRGPTKEEKGYLEKAKELFTEALNEYQRNNLTASMVRTLLKRATVHMGLNNNRVMEEDVLFAYKLAPSDPEVVFRYAGMKVKEEDWNGAISLLETLIGKGLRCTAELFLSQCLEKRNSKGDAERAISLLRSRLNDLSQEESNFRAEYLATLIDLERKTKGIETVIKTLETLKENIVSVELVKVLRGEVYRLNGDKTRAVSEAKKVIGGISAQTSIQDKRRIATFLQAVGMYKEALELWKTIVKPEYIGRDTYRLMECAHQCEDVTLITEFAERLRANALWERKLFELELNYREKYNDDKGAEKVMEGFLANPPDKAYAPYVRTRLSILGIRSEQKELIEKDPKKLPSVTEVGPRVGRMVALILRHGPDPVKGVEYAYELLRLNWNHSETYEAHIAMIESVIAPFGPPVSINQPEIVAPGVAVRYEEKDTGIKRWHIIENSIVAPPNPGYNEFPPEHPISKAMEGEKCGDEFRLREDGLQDRNATIKQIMSKYVYRFNYCLEEIETRFPHQNAIRKFIAIDKAGKLDTAPLDRLAKQDAEFVQKLEDIYESILCPVSFLAIKKGRTILEAMNFIMAKPGLKLKCCRGSDEEERIAEEAIGKADSIVIDGTAIITLLFAQIYEQVCRFKAKLIVSRGTLKALQSADILQGTPERLAGSYSSNGFISYSADDVKKERARIEDLIKFINQNCILESGLAVAEIEKEKREQLIQIVGRDSVESMMLATPSNRVLWTDDLAMAELARTEFGCQRVWTQFLFNHFADLGLIERKISEELTMLLMQLEYYYTKPTVGAIILAVKKADGDVDKGPLFQALNWFSDPNAKIEGQYYIASGVIKKIWQEDALGIKAQRVTIRILERLSQRQGGFRVIEGLLSNIDRIFGLDVINADKAKKTIKGWLAGKRIILP